MNCWLFGTETGASTRSVFFLLAVQAHLPYVNQVFDASLMMVAPTEVDGALVLKARNQHL